MKFTGAGVFQNENSDMRNLGYIEYGLDSIREGIEYLKTSDRETQGVLADIQIVIFLIELLPHTMSGRLKRSEVNEWQKHYNEWFERVKHKIPKKYRDDIKKDAERLFEELKGYAHNIEWL